MKKIEKEKKIKLGNKAKALIIVGVVALVFAVIVWGLLVATENAVLGKYDKTVVYMANMDIAQGTQITEPNVFKTKSVDSDIVPSDAITDLSSIKDTYTLYAIPENGILTSDMFGELADVEVGTREVGFNVDEISGGVNGIIRASDYIDIYVIDDSYSINGEEKDGWITYMSEDDTETTTDIFGETEDEEEILSPTFSRVYVSKVFNEDGLEVANEDTESIVTNFNVVLDVDDADYLISAMQTGKIYITLCRD